MAVRDKIRPPVLNAEEARQLHKEALGRLQKKMKSVARPEEDAW